MKSLNKDPIFELCNRYFNDLFININKIFLYENYLLENEKIFYYEEINKIFVKIGEIIMNIDYCDLFCKYPNILCFENSFPTLFRIPVGNKNKPNSVITYQKILTRVKASKTEEAFQFYANVFKIVKMKLMHLWS